MANLNKVILIGRLTRDPETRVFQTGGMVAKFGFAVTNRKKNATTGQWEDDPMFVDVDVFNRGEFGKLADLVRDRCRKGSQLMLEGKLILDRWDDKVTNEKRSKLKIVADNIQLLDPRTDGAGGSEHSGGSEEEGMEAPPARSNNSYGNNRGAAPRTPAKPNAGYSAGPDDDQNNDDHQTGEIPF